MSPRFVDCDDGAASDDEGLALCHSAAEHGTRILFATPHIWPYFTLSEEREAEIREAFERMRPRAELELRLRARRHGRSASSSRSDLGRAHSCWAVRPPLEHGGDSALAVFCVPFALSMTGSHSC